MKNYHFLLKLFLCFGFLVLLSGCTIFNSQEESLAEGGTLEGVSQEEPRFNYDEEDEGEFFVVREIVQKEGFKNMFLTSSDEQGNLLLNTIPLGISVDMETLVEMEEGNLDNPIRRGATIEDILEGDLLKLYMRERVGGSVHLLENYLDRIVIVRFDDR